MFCIEVFCRTKRLLYVSIELPCYSEWQVSSCGSKSSISNHVRERKQNGYKAALLF